MRRQTIRCESRKFANVRYEIHKSSHLSIFQPESYKSTTIFHFLLGLLSTVFGVLREQNRLDSLLSQVTNLSSSHMQRLAL